MQPFDFIGIGDITIDAFIRLKEAAVHCKLNHEECEICLKFGDKVPYQDVFIVPAVGNSANASVAAARLGLKSALVANVGDDRHGQECIDALKKSGVATEYVKVNECCKTNYHYVLWYDNDRTILIKHNKYHYELPDIDDPKWIYLSSLGEHAEMFHDDIERYLFSHPTVKFAFQPGTFQIRMGRERMRVMYKRADVFICNKEEAERILGVPEQSEIKTLLHGLADLGPKVVVMTDGPRGAYAIANGGRMWFMPIYPDPKPPYERTGAGDAFSSTFVAALALGKSVEEALMWAPINAMSVVQEVGAQAGLLTREKLELYLKNAPANYKPQAL